MADAVGCQNRGTHAMEGLRAQFVMRRCSGEADVGIGMIEAPIGYLETGPRADALHDLVVDQEGTIHFAGLRREVPSSVAESDLASALTTLEFPRAQRPWRGGSLLVRSSRAPVAVGRQIMLAAIVMEKGDHEYRDDVIHEGTIHGSSMTISETGTALPFRPHGMALCQIHKSPIWGWGAELIGPVSTMRLDVIDECAEADALVGDERPESAARLEQLMRGPAGWTVQAARKDRHRDHEYKQFRRKMIERFGPIDWSGWRTSAEEHERDAYALEIMRDITA